MFKFGGNSFGFGACHQKLSSQTGCLLELHWGIAGSSFGFARGVFPFLVLCIAKQSISNNPTVVEFLCKKTRTKNLGLSKMFYSNSDPRNAALDLQNERSGGSMENSPILLFKSRHFCEIFSIIQQDLPLSPNSPGLL